MSINDWEKKWLLIVAFLLCVSLFPLHVCMHHEENVIKEWVFKKKKKCTECNRNFFFCFKSSFYHSNTRIMKAEKSTWNKIDWSGKTNVLYELMIDYYFYSVIINNSMWKKKPECVIHAIMENSAYFNLVTIGFIMS